MPSPKDIAPPDLLALKREMMQNLQAMILGGHAPHSLPPGVWQPPTDVYQTKDAVFVRANVAGVDPGEVTVTVDQHRLIIEGRRRDTSRSPGAQFRQMEIEYGPFRRVVPLPGAIDPSGARASCRHGLLEITAPQAPTVPAARVVIRVVAAT